MASKATASGRVDADDIQGYCGWHPRLSAGFTIPVWDFDFLVFWKYFLKIINWLKDLDLDSEETMPPKVQPVLICT